MNFHDLKAIVGQIKRGMRCQTCNGKYTDFDVDIIGITSCEESFFQVFCPNCNMEAVIHVHTDIAGVPYDEEDMPIRLGSAPRMEYISSNEVLDMHNFLKNFSGSFDEIFKEKHQNS
ncbi:MAG: hypothetical protein WC777_03545 [Candidatus Gracilibacteria bacterium]|jgi:hypothetical protein